MSVLTASGKGSRTSPDTRDSRCLASSTPFDSNVLLKSTLQQRSQLQHLAGDFRPLFKAAVKAAVKPYSIQQKQQVR